MPISCHFYISFMSILYQKAITNLQQFFWTWVWPPTPLLNNVKKKEQNWSGMASLIAEVQCKSRWMTARGNRGNWRNMPTLCKDIIDQNFWGHLEGDCRNFLTCLWLLWPRDWEEATSRFWWLALEHSRDANTSPGCAQYLPLLTQVSGKSSLNDSSFLSAKIWSTMSVAIPACKFEEWGDVDKNEGQWLTEQLRGVTKQNSVIVRSSHEQSSISGEINEELISIDEIYCWPILNIDLFELILVGTFHLIHHSMCSEWRGGSTTFVQLPWAPIHLGRHHKPGVQSRGRRLLLVLPPSPLPQPVQEPQVVPGLPLPGSHRAGRVHQRLGQRGHHQHREEVPLAVHPVRHHRLLLRHRLPGGDDTGEHFSPDDPADSKSFLLVSSHLWLGMANNTLVTHWLCEISSMFLWDLPHRGGICPSRQCRRQCKIFASGVNFSIFTHCLCFFLTKTVEIR